MTTTDALPPPRRWDPLVRITHWAIVVAVIVNALVTEEGSGAHIWVGYALTALLALRLLWGLIGTPEARFAAFPPSPSKAFGHIRDIGAGRHKSHESHNPLGALMVYAIWACLGVVITTGIAMAPPSAALWSGRGAERGEAVVRPITVSEDDAHEGGEAGEHEEGATGEVHEAAVYLLYVLIALHLAGIVFETRRSGRQIVTAMLSWRVRSERN